MSGTWIDCLCIIVCSSRSAWDRWICFVILDIRKSVPVREIHETNNELIYNIVICPGLLASLKPQALVARQTRNATDFSFIGLMPVILKHRGCYNLVNQNTLLYGSKGTFHCTQLNRISNGASRYVVAWNKSLNIASLFVVCCLNTNWLLTTVSHGAILRHLEWTTIVKSQPIRNCEV